MNGGDHLHTCAMLGAYHAARGVEDGVILCHSPAGCEKMILHAVAAHDALGLRHRDVALCQVGDPEAVFGGEAKLGEALQRLRAERPGRHVFILSSCAPEVVGDDLPAVIGSCSPGAATWLGTAGFRGDLWAGFAEALGAMTLSLCAGESRGRPSARLVNLSGYLCDRLEHDHLANLRILAAMLRALGLGLNVCLGGPTSTRRLRRAWAAGWNLAFDYGEPAAAALARRYGRPALHLDYPLGLRGTEAFLRGVGRAVGREAAARAFIERSLRWAVPRIAAVRAACVGRRVGVAADSQRLPGLLQLLIDLGMTPVWVRILDQGGAIRPRLKRLLAGYPARIDPSGPEIGETLGALDLIVGTTLEKYRYGSRVPVYEFGYPCFDRHCLADEPDLGFEGAVRLANGLANLLRRGPTRQFGVLPEEFMRLQLEPPLYFACRARGGRLPR